MDYSIATSIKNFVFQKVSQYLNDNGIQLSKETLQANIHLTRDEVSNICNPKKKSKPKFNVKSKKSSKSSASEKPSEPLKKSTNDLTSEKPSAPLKKTTNDHTSEKPSEPLKKSTNDSTSEKSSEPLNKTTNDMTSEKPSEPLNKTTNDMTSEKPSEPLKKSTNDSASEPLKKLPNKFKLKPKPTTTTTTTTTDTTIQQNTFDIFVDICNKYNIPYFKYNDEQLWNGPAIKILISQLDLYKTYFEIINIKYVKTNDYYIIRPEKYENDSHIQYPHDLSHCKLIENTLITSTSDDEQNEQNENMEEIETTPWTFDNTKYLVDDKNNVYCFDTIDFVGTKLFSEQYEKYIIDFNASEV